MTTGIDQVYVGVWDDKNEREIWRATNQPVRADYLVVLNVDADTGDPKVVERYTTSLGELSGHAISRQDLSQYTWLFSTDLTLNGVFNAVLRHMGVEHHDFTVVELATGNGFSFNAKRRAVYEISPRKAG